MHVHLSYFRVIPVKDMVFPCPSPWFLLKTQRVCNAQAQRYTCNPTAHQCIHLVVKVHGARQVFRHPTAGGVHGAQVVLRGGVALGYKEGSKKKKKKKGDQRRQHKLERLKSRTSLVQ